MRLWQSVQVELARVDRSHDCSRPRRGSACPRWGRSWRGRVLVAIDAGRRPAGAEGAAAAAGPPGWLAGGGRSGCASGGAGGRLGAAWSGRMAVQAHAVFISAMTAGGWLHSAAHGVARQAVLPALYRVGGLGLQVRGPRGRAGKTGSYGHAAAAWLPARRSVGATLTPLSAQRPCLHSFSSSG